MSADKPYATCVRTRVFSFVRLEVARCGRARGVDARDVRCEMVNHLNECLNRAVAMMTDARRRDAFYSV